MLFGYLSYSKEISLEESNQYSQFLSGPSFGVSESITNDFGQLKINIAKHPNLPSYSARIYQSDNSDIIIVLIGTIFHYNDELVASQNLSQLLIEQYLCHGIHFLKNLNGEFSICIFDFKKGEHYFGKDHIGTTPLTLIEKDRGVYFGTDTNGMAKSMFKDSRIDSSYIKSRFYGYEENFHYTPFPKITKVLPAHYAELVNSSINQTCYWSPINSKTNTSIDFSSAVDKLHELLIDSVKVRIRGDHNIGAHYSGGLDSSIVAAIARELCPAQKDFFGFSWSPGNYSFKGDLTQDERVLIRAQAKKSSIIPVFINTDIKDYINYLSNWRSQGDFHHLKPTESEAQKKGVHLMFSGWGGDEFIGLPKDAIFQELFRKGRFLKLIGLSEKNGFKERSIHIYNNVLFPFRRRASLKYKSGLRIARYLKKWDNQQVNKRSIFRTKNNYMLHLMSYYHNAQRCEAWYTSGQRNGIVYTYPLLDKRIIEYCFSLKMEHFAASKLNKPLLRAIGKEYLINELRSQKQLLDPTLLEQKNELDHQAAKLLASELKDYKQNPYLNFVDFEKINSEIDSIDFDDPKKTSDISHILSYLKSVHSYTINVGKSE